MLQKAESFKKLQITQNDQTDLGDQTDQTDQTYRMRERWCKTVKHAKLPISSFDLSVSESVTIISARDAGASEKLKLIDLSDRKL